MITYYFKCKGCGEQFEKFRMGLTRLNEWKEGKLKIACPKCKKKKHEQIIPVGSGNFKSFHWH